MHIPEIDKPSSVIPIFSAGLFFGILQSAIYFSVLVFVTATFMGYFIIMLMWVSGAAIVLRVNFTFNIRTSLTFTLCIFYLFLLVVKTSTPSVWLYPLYGIMVLCMAFPSGQIIKLFAEKISAGSLFLQENNGFIIGSILGFILFLKFGVRFIYLAPVIAFMLTIFSFYGKKKYIILFWTITGTYFVITGYNIGTIASLVLLIIFILFNRIAPNNNAIIGHENLEQNRINSSSLTAIVFISGCNVALLQYFIVREFSTILSANELSIQIVSISYFSGFSIGYFLSKYISIKTLRILSVATFFVHLCILIFIKFALAYLLFAGYNLGVLTVILFTSALLTSAYYSVFLPKAVNLMGAISTSKFYLIELVGAVCGVLMIFITLSYSFTSLWILYLILLLFLVHLVLGKIKMSFSFLFFSAGIIIFYAWHHQEFSNKAASDYYQTRGYKNNNVIFAENSFYHSVEVIET
ncbi:MAG: hypothetical protein HYV28_08985, partial [Ignavibacteriales bacterium]|nr:hypothetical protein [Ignavibacteriales bacterium]